MVKSLFKPGFNLTAKTWLAVFFLHKIIDKLATGLLSPTFGEIEIGGFAPGIETKAMVSYLPERTG